MPNAKPCNNHEKWRVRTPQLCATCYGSCRGFRRCHPQQEDVLKITKPQRVYLLHQTHNQLNYPIEDHSNFRVKSGGVCLRSPTGLLGRSCTIRLSQFELLFRVHDTLYIYFFFFTNYTILCRVGGYLTTSSSGPCGQGVDSSRTCRIYIYSKKT